MSLKKEINLNKKFIIIMILVNLIALGLYYSYALFETKVIKDNVVIIKTLSINITTDVSDYEHNRITLLSGESKTLTINLESNYTSPNAYKLYYKLISGEANIKSTSITTIGEINESLSITCIIENRGEVDTTIELGTKGGLIGYEIELDDDCYALNKVVNVTFDYQDNATESATRKVVVGEEYGELPTPNERSGYTFMGWNGKNMFNEEEILMAIDDATYENNHYVFTLGNAHRKYTLAKEIPIYNFKENMQYTVTMMGYNDECNEIKCFTTDQVRILLQPTYKDDPTINIFSLNTLEESTVSYTTIEGKNVLYFNMSYGNGGDTYTHISHIQLEEGDTATEWEPYYVTIDVAVTQTKDHTLKAIWKENS